MIKYIVIYLTIKTKNMTNTTCPIFKYWEPDLSSCQLCSPSQETNGIITLCLIGIFSFALICCCCCKLCSLVGLLFVIAINQMYCNVKWNNSVNQLLVIIEFFMLCIGIAIIKEEFKRRIIR